jgi:phosphoribosylformylglycinamidine (FGAM) synthase-like enzyme
MGGLGFDVALDDELEAAVSLFSETQSRFVLSCAAEKVEDVLDMLEELSIPFSVLGDVTDADLVIEDKLHLSIDEAYDVWTNSLERLVKADTGSDSSEVRA